MTPLDPVCDVSALRQFGKLDDADLNAELV
jgi:hypothetical protein